MPSASTDQDSPDNGAGAPETAQLSGRRARWQELDEFLRRVDAHGLDSLGADGLERLALLYRSASADLARSQSEGWPRQVREYLNDLVVRAHAKVYAVQPRRRLGLLVYFFGVVPTTFRRRWAYVAATTALSVAVAAFVYAGVRHDPALARRLMPGGFTDVIEDFAKSGKSAGHYFSDRPEGKLLGGASFSTYLFLHNLKVALITFAGGIIFGLVTVLELVLNGVMLGVFLAIGANVGALGKMVSVVAPHGALELPAIFVAAAGGLLMGHALVNPGRWRRGDALKLAARDALALFIVSAPLLLAAGIIEGNISPRFEGVFGSDQARFAFACVMLGVMILYLARGDRLLDPLRRRRIPPAPEWP
jgi:uncharacterized membrane protein SpoIIM required for sporulation